MCVCDPQEKYKSKHQIEQHRFYFSSQKCLEKKKNNENVHKIKSQNTNDMWIDLKKLEKEG